MLASALALVSLQSCAQLQTFSTQVLPYISQENVAMVSVSIFLKKHPEAATDCLRVADKLRALADQGVLNMDQLYDELAKAIVQSDTQVKQELLVAVKAAINEYEYVLNTHELDVTTYKNVLLEIARGIEDAVQISDILQPEIMETK